MRPFALVCLLLVLAPLSAPARAQGSAAEQPLEDLVSVDFRDVPLSQVVNALIYRRNVNILAPPEMNQRVTVKLEAVPWKSALQTILQNFGYGFEEIDGIIRVDLLANLNKTLLTRNYEVRFLDSEGVQRFLGPLLTRPDAGRLVESGVKDGVPGKRVFIVTDVPQVHTRIEETLREFDRPTIEGAREVVGPTADGAMGVHFEGTRLADAIGSIAARLRLSVAWEARPTGTVDLQVANLDLERILDLLLLPRKMLYEYDERLIRIGPLDGFRPRTVTRTFTLKYANAIELQRLIKSRMTQLGRVEFLVSTYGTQAPLTGPVTGATLPGQVTLPAVQALQQPNQQTTQSNNAGSGNAVQPGQITGNAGSKEQPTISRAFVVTDTLQVMRDLEKIVKLADVPPSQVGIDVQLVEVQLTKNDSLGIQWNLAAEGNGAAAGSPFPFTKPPVNADGTAFTPVGNTFQFGTVSFTNFRYLLNALAQNNRLRTLSKPSVTTLDQQEATILVGERFPLVTTTQDQFGRQTFSQSGEVQIGIQLRVVPQIMDKRHISLNIHPQVSNRGDLIQNQFPVVQTREVNTQLMVQQGDTAVIAGLIQDRDNRTRQGIPGLMDLGVIGHLFGRRGYERVKSELMIFVTPRIVAYNPGPVSQPPLGGQ